MKRFASHYLLIPAVGYMKQQVVEITDEGVVRGVFSLTEEIWTHRQPWHFRLMPTMIPLMLMKPAM